MRRKAIIQAANQHQFAIVFVSYDDFKVIYMTKLGISAFQICELLAAKWRQVAGPSVSPRTLSASGDPFILKKCRH
jgi:hypothetical protein